MEIISKKSLSTVEMKEKLTEIKVRDKELNFRGKKVEEFLNIVTKDKQNKELRKDLEGLDLTRLTEYHITLILNVMPVDLDSLRTILSGENLTLKPEDLQKILDTVKKYV
jgi:DNA-directed RNA polymerase subunit F